MSQILMNAVVAIEKGVKGRVSAELTELHKSTSKAEPLYGFIRTYQKKDDAGMDLPEESKRVQLLADEVLRRVANAATELYDITATKDYGNTIAKADVVIDGVVIIPAVPVPFLLFLEKQIVDIRTFMEKFVALDDGHEWTKDDKSLTWKSNPQTTHRTEKLQESLVMAQATKEFPAQTQLIVRDVVVGYWKTILLSGALPSVRRREIVERCDVLLKAIKQAREEANNTKVERREVGGAIFGYLFK